MSVLDRLKRRPVMPPVQASVIDPEVVDRLDEVTTRLEDMVTRLAARLDERESERATEVKRAGDKTTTTRTDSTTHETTEPGGSGD